MPLKRYEKIDDKCPKSSTGTHEPDWQSVAISYDGGETYIDINCLYCERSGCLGTSKTLTDNIMW